jgi:hypothetical protein
VGPVRGRPARCGRGWLARAPCPRRTSDVVIAVSSSRSSTWV